MTPRPDPWTPEIEAQLMRLQAAAEANPKITYQVIADRLNEAFGTSLTRNAVAGRLNQLNDGAKPKTASSAPVWPAQPALPKRYLAPQEPPQSTHVTLLERKPWQCGWPVNDGGPFLFCGAPKAGDPVYCDRHREIATGRPFRGSRSAAS